MVYVPRPEPSSPPVPEYTLTPELEVNRLNTAFFVAQNPREISLNPRARVRTPSGAWTTQGAVPRPTQTFRLIMQSPSGSSLEQATAESGDVERDIEWVLLGHWDADMDIGDWWEEGDIHFELKDLAPYNGYERQAIVSATGKHP
jgi:hypothetical protein